jgi:Zinc dependent phospholipase C
MQKKLQSIFWLIPIIFHANEANAWGLVTHVYFAHSLLWAMPLLDPRLRKAIENFPDLVMAGACLPDLAIISKRFCKTHSWQNAHALLENAKNEEELAIAIGFASHLYIDVIAHNHFVPAHEEMWSDKGMLTHISSEWAMDAHLSPLLSKSPGALLRANAAKLAQFIAPQFNCDIKDTKRLILKLSFWDRVLRAFKIPNAIYHASRMLDKRVHKNFIYYIAKTQVAITDIGIVLSGIKPSWEAELLNLNASQLSAWRLECLGELALLHPAPIQYFVPNN